ncbi:FAD-binding domain-containing protein [Lentithecium fluviatile CBS 122367]|uniref:FAD-binding domain-containing protein n=1 Tax=Lentithecium fluviatile CBS 122367 TaxID=1168545 RepID=A0A6G1J0D5_9PLEO|nr:FAD-binding domain-containing protein [Lentithecium fluviatile CBS 122367]
MLLYFFFAVSTAATAFALNFDYENIQLTEAETQDYPAIRFADLANPLPRKECRAIPGDDDWPSDADWAQFNETLGGVLLKPVPLAAPCYEGALYNATRCEQLKRTWSNIGMHSNDPTSIMSQWASGNTCVPTSQPNSTCSQGGYPVYVVDAMNVRHIQLAVNFARNKNIRLVIKGGGHDFNGKSIGGHSLSIWVHNLKSLIYHPEYSTSTYSGRAVALGGGTQAQDARNLMSRNNATILTAGGANVGLAGGFFQGAGHSGYTSYYGLAADHVLEINAVTANGRLVTANADTNSDLFWAFRGGGGGTFGVVTSIVEKAFPQTAISSGSITFSTIPSRTQPTANLTTETFWAGMKAYWEYAIPICDAGGLGYNFIRHGANPTRPDVPGLTYTVSISLPGRTAAEYRSFVRPLLERLSEVGIPIAIPEIQTLVMPELDSDQPSHPLARRAPGDTVGHTLIASRLWPRTNFDTPSALQTSHLAIRSFVEDGGYDFHGMNYAPTLAVSGNPDNAVHPAFRTTVMHAQGYEVGAHWDGSNVITWRDITPGSGAYMNEGDMQEPDWKDSFYGSNYPRLLQVKKKWDPYGVFWAISGVGSDEWVVYGSGGGRGGLYTQDGRICRA